ncbi:flavin reductase family protein [Streptomyces sp. NPDC056437]|uniref:flavin reductase family protein n=1 Tax=Streptomyces sp. NPDC056437 TaxID=3345816 RepID=UPI0036C1E1A9
MAGRFPTGVTVITATTAYGPVGFTCQSFTSLSLDPPLVSYNVSRSSGTWPLIREAGAFCVNVLAAGQEKIAQSFSERGVDRFDGVCYTCALGNGSPRLAGATAWMDATIEDVCSGGDHLIVIGRVVAAATGEDEQALLYHRGLYRSAHLNLHLGDARSSNALSDRQHRLHR